MILMSRARFISAVPHSLGTADARPSPGCGLGIAGAHRSVRISCIVCAHTCMHGYMCKGARSRASSPRQQRLRRLSRQARTRITRTLLARRIVHRALPRVCSYTYLASMRASMHASIHPSTYLYVHTCMHVCMHMRTGEDVRTCTCACTCAYMGACAHAFTRACTRARVHEYCEQRSG